MKTTPYLKLFTLLIFALLTVTCGSGGEKNAHGAYVFTPGKFKPKKFPLEIPFDAIGERMNKFYWVESIVCTGRLKGEGYTLAIRGTGNASNAHLTLNARSFTLFAKTTTNQIQILGEYFFPSVEEGKPFSFEIRTLFDGYFDASDFGGLLLTDEYFKPY